MPTSFVSTVFVVLTTLNNAGQLAPVDKSELPTGYTAMLWSTEQCMFVRGKMSHPEKYVCQVFKGETSTPWVYGQPESGEPTLPSGPPPAPKPDPTNYQPGDIRINNRWYTQIAGTWVEIGYERSSSFDDVQVGPTQLGEKDTPVIAPTPVKVPQAKQVAQAPQWRVYRAAPSDSMLDGGPNPFGLLAGLISGRRGDW